MVEKKITMEELLKKYKFVSGRRPKKDDLVYIQSQGAIYTVESVDSMKVTVERSHKGSGLKLKVPPSQYKLIEIIS